jgi:anthranilate synthase component I
MENLSKDKFISSYSTEKVISLSRKIVLDVATPVSVLHRFLEEPHFVFLESISEHAKYDRFSFFAFDPHVLINCYPDKISLDYADGKKEEKVENLYDFLDSFIKEYHCEDEDGINFQSGIVGTMSYECVQFLEDIKFPKTRELNTPLASFIMPRSVLIFDNLFNTLTIVRNVIPDAQNSKSPALIYEDTIKELDKLQTRIIEPMDDVIMPFELVDKEEPIDYDCSIDDDSYKKKVDICKDYIAKGDIFQIQISRRCYIDLKEGDNNFMLYRYLRYQNPSPFLYYIKLKDEALIGASPEILVNVDDRVMTIRPIAGTRKRFSNNRSEKEIEEELINDPKERAEHIMLVDLARHEIAQACKSGSVKVNELMITEKYSHVIHLVSDVTGELKDGYTSIDALKFGFPAGTVTGTPKIRAMEIISELENIQREFYAGGIVFLDFRGNMKSALTIRSLYVKGNRAYTHAAAGVVTDSTPEMELKETKNKLRSCLSAMHKFRKNK